MYLFYICKTAIYYIHSLFISHIFKVYQCEKRMRMRISLQKSRALALNEYCYDLLISWCWTGLLIYKEKPLAYILSQCYST